MGDEDVVLIKAAGWSEVIRPDRATAAVQQEMTIRVCNAQRLNLSDWHTANWLAGKSTGKLADRHLRWRPRRRRRLGTGAKEQSDENGAIFHGGVLLHFVPCHISVRSSIVSVQLADDVAQMSQLQISFATSPLASSRHQKHASF